MQDCFAGIDWDCLARTTNALVVISLQLLLGNTSLGVTLTAVLASWVSARESWTGMHRGNSARDLAFRSRKLGDFPCMPLLQVAAPP